MKKASMDRWVGMIFVFGFLYALFMSQGLPLWDDDFTSWLSQSQAMTWLEIFKAVLSPTLSHPETWGFNERPLEILFYKICFGISGYHSWSYFLVKSLAYGGLGALVYVWGRQLISPVLDKHSIGKKASLLAAIFFMICPGSLASHILLADFAPISELFFLILAYLSWNWIEKTPLHWRSWKSVLRNQSAWWIYGIVLCFGVYIGTKAKADLRLIPLILGAYLLIYRRHQSFFFLPLSLMTILCIPWNLSVFTQLPPFFPGSKGSDVFWMWQPASLNRMMDFLWSKEKLDLMSWFRCPTLSLGGVLGPFLLVGVSTAPIYQWFKKKNHHFYGKPFSERHYRATVFVVLWLIVILISVSSLASINYLFRVRYGILTLVPTSILLARAFVELKKVPRVLSILACFLIVIQIGVNLTRSLAYRGNLGRIIVAVDQVYNYVNTNFSTQRLVLLSDFQRYAYRPDANPVIQTREILSLTNESDLKGIDRNTYFISWNPPQVASLKVVRLFSGCQDWVLFDRLFPCVSGVGAYLQTRVPFTEKN